MWEKREAHVHAVQTLHTTSVAPCRMRHMDPPIVRPEGYAHRVTILLVPMSLMPGNGTVCETLTVVTLLNAKSISSNSNRAFRRYLASEEDEANSSDGNGMKRRFCIDMKRGGDMK